MVQRIVLVAVVVLGAGIVVAQTGDDFALKLERVTTPGTEVIVVGSWKVDGIQGWSWGLCHNSAQVSIGTCSSKMPNSGASNVVCASADLCANVRCTDDLLSPGPNNEPVGFLSLNGFDGGITQGAVLDFAQSWSLNKTDRFEMLRVKYDLNGGVTTSRVDFCATLGTPPVDITFVVNGNSFPPNTREGIDIPGGGGPCTLSLEMKFGAPQVTGQPGQQVASLPVLLTTGEEHPASGFQFGVALNTADAKVDSVAEGAALAAAMGGPVDFFGVQILAGGVTVGAVLDLEPQGTPPTFITLPKCTADQEIAVVKVVCNAQKGDTNVSASFSSQLGTPPVAIVVDVDGTSFAPALGSPASFTLSCPTVARENFVRGDANQDGTINVSDGVAIAKAVFGQGSKLQLIMNCKDSADTNDDGKMDTADAVYLLEWLFTAGPAIKAPNTCGPDPTTPAQDTLDCPSYPPCAG